MQGESLALIFGSRTVGQKFHSGRNPQRLCEILGFSGIIGSNTEALELKGHQNMDCIPRRDLTFSPLDGRPTTVALTFIPWEGAAAGGDPVLPSHSLQGPSSVQFSSVAQSCLALCYPMDCSTPGLPVHHHLPELAQTHMHRVCDAIQPSHPLSFPSPPTFNISQHQGLSK